MTHELDGLDFIPERFQAEMRSYVEDGMRPRNPFLFAVLTNDLFQTYKYAEDAFNRDQLFNYIFFLTKYAPPNCFGSRTKVEAWIEDAAERRAMAEGSAAIALETRSVAP